MLTEICADLKNYFVTDNKDILHGTYSVEDGQIVPLLSLQDGQYYRIIGSVFNDGVHKQGDSLKDESSFDGSIWLMRVPQDVIDLDEAITEWMAKNASVDSPAMSPFNSESFGGYSYTKGSYSSSADSSSGANWQSVFASQLNRYRKIRVI